MRTITLGNRGPVVSVLGLGCMGMSEFYGPADDVQSVATIERAIDLGVTLIDTADSYGGGHNETLVGKAIGPRRDRIVLATKFGNVRGAKPDERGTNGRPEYVAAACEQSLKRLGVEFIDIYFLHRVDPQTPIEDTVGAMAKLVAQGKVRHLGLCEVGLATLRRAVAVHPIAAVQSEYSLWTRDPEARVLPACRELGVGFIAFSPLGRGFLGGEIKQRADLTAEDRRLRMPRFEADSLQKNVARIEQLEAIAARSDCTLAQLALAWVLAQGRNSDIAAIPGTRRIARLEENLAAAKILLSAEVLSEIDAICPPGAFSGERFGAADLARVSQ